MIEAEVRPRGPFVLRLGLYGKGHWRASLPGGESAGARQRLDGVVVVRASSVGAVERARFMLSLDDDHSEFLRRFAQDRLLGRTVGAIPGLRPPRVPTVAHALLRGLCGQLIESSRARALERRILRLLGTRAPTQAELARPAPAALRAHGLSAERASALVRICRGLDLERLRTVPTAAVVARLLRERTIGPWTCGVVALEGLGRWDQGLVGDLGLIKLAASLRGRWIEPWETEELLAPYAPWEGLASVYLLAGWKRGLVPGADRDVARLVRARSRAA